MVSKLNPQKIIFWLGMPLVLLTLIVGMISKPETVSSYEVNALEAIILEDDTQKIYNDVKVVLADSGVMYIGNYRAELILQMSTVADQLGMKYFTTRPYSETCNKPGTTCSWDADYLAMHIDRLRTQEFWDTFCLQYESVLCGN